MDFSIENFDFSEYFKEYGYDSSRNFVLFYGSKGQDLFGNFWKLPKKIRYGGIEADNVETLYHAMKFPEDMRKKFENLPAIKAFYLSRFNKKNMRSDWNDIKEKIMLDLLRLKFHIPRCALVLLSTGAKYLVEHNAVKGRDDYWSDNHDGSGKNRLGILLMQIRSELFGHGIVDKPIEYINWIKNK